MRSSFVRAWQRWLPGWQLSQGYAECNAQQIWGSAAAEVIREGATPQAAAEKALACIGSILAKYDRAELRRGDHGRGPTF